MLCFITKNMLLYNCVMLYNMLDIMLYHMCHLVLYNMCHVMLCYITFIIL